MLTERHVVACFLTSKGRILLLKRSNQVGTYQGRWAGVSGSVKDEPLAQAMREVHEETGLLPQDVHLVRRGPAIEVVDRGKHVRWQMHPFLFRVEEPDAIQLSWEHIEFRWVDPRQIDQFNTVPMLAEALARVWDSGELGPMTAYVRSHEIDPAVPPPPPEQLQPDPVGDSDRGLVPEVAEDESEPSQHAGVRVRVVRSTGEFPRPELRVTRAGQERTPPGKTGAELLEDPLLAPALAAIRDDRVHGASILTVQALDALGLTGERSTAESPRAWLADLRLVGQSLAGLRPSMAAISHAIAQVLYELDFELDRVDGREALRAALTQGIEKVKEQEASAASMLADEVSRLIPPGGTVMSLGYSTAVVEGLQRCRHFGIRVIVPEGRPLNEGRLLARAVLAMGKSATVITDAAIGVHAHEADLAIIGAEALLADGSVVNKTGSYLLALAAKAARIPLYVAAPLLKLDLRPDAALKVVLEEKESAEVWSENVPGLEVRNVYYERVPADLITGIVTEDGLLESSGIDWEVKARDYLLEALHGAPPA